MNAPLITIQETTSFSPRSLEQFKQAGWLTRMDEAPLPPPSVDPQEIQGMIIRFGQRWTEEVFDRFPNLRFLGVPATGTDHIDLEAAAQREIQVHSLLGLPGLDRITATPELAFGLMIALLRHLPAATQSVEEGQWNRDLFFGRQLAGKKVGIIGLGRTGSAFAKRAEAFDMSVSYYDPYVDQKPYPRHPSLEDLATASDIISLHVVLKPETKGLLGPSFFEALHGDCWLINTSRGDLVDEQALLRALKEGRLTGAALDVIQQEPEKGHPLSSPVVEYARQSSNCILTPHIGGATAESIHQAEDILVEDILRHHRV